MMVWDSVCFVGVSWCHHCYIAVLHPILLFKLPFRGNWCWEHPCLTALCPCQGCARTALCCCGVYIQGEAVLQVLRMTGSSMQLLDLSDHLPGLPRLPGLKKWYARDKIQYYSNWEEANQVCICSLAIHHLNFLDIHSAACYRSHMTVAAMLESRCLIKHIVFRSLPCNSDLAWESLCLLAPHSFLVAINITCCKACEACCGRHRPASILP